jgi:hypothetical protein
MFLKKGEKNFDMVATPHGSLLKFFQTLQADKVDKFFQNDYPCLSLLIVAILSYI